MVVKVIVAMHPFEGPSEIAIFKMHAKKNGTTITSFFKVFIVLSKTIYYLVRMFSVII